MSGARENTDESGTVTVGLLHYTDVGMGMTTQDQRYATCPIWPEKVRTKGPRRPGDPV
jgi:hypothetical protein